MARYDISIVLASYNKGQILQHTLPAFSNQTLAPDRYEIIIVDDGSIDDTASFIERFESLVPIRYTTMKREGYNIARVRNRGLELAQAEIVLIMDADIIARSDLVEQHLKAHQLQPQAVILGYVYAVAISADRWRELVENPTGWDFSNPTNLFKQASQEPALGDPREMRIGNHDINDLPAPWLCFWTNNVSMSKGVFKKVGVFDEKMTRSSDLEMGYRLWRFGCTFVYCREASGFHFPHPRDYSVDAALDYTSELYMFNKHPDPTTEILTAFGFNQASKELVYWQKLQDSDARAPIYSLSEQNVSDLQAFLKTSGNSLIIGLPNNTYLSLEFSDAAVWSQELTEILEQDFPDVRYHHVIGLRLPCDNQSFDQILISDRWRFLKDHWLEKLVLEAFRIGKRVFFLDIVPGDRVISITERPSGKRLGRLLANYTFAYRTHSYLKPHMSTACLYEVMRI